MKVNNITCNILATTSQMCQNCCTHSKSECVIATTLVQNIKILVLVNFRLDTMYTYYLFFVVANI